MKGTQAESSYRSYSFLDALFQHTEVVLSSFNPNMDISKVAQEFRRLMTTGQTMKKHNQFRRNFYENVIRIAKENFTKAQMVCCPNLNVTLTEHSTKDPDSAGEERALSPLNTLKKLLTALRARDRANKASPLLRATMPKRSKKSGAGQVGAEPQDKVPLVILAFDEAHTLTDREAEREGVLWSNFSELSHVLRGLHYHPLFSLFLSTTGKISQFTSAKDEDSSKRVINSTLTLIQPFTDLGFDTLATPVSLDGSWNLEKVTTDSHMAHLGRPLHALFILFYHVYTNVNTPQGSGLAMMLATKLSEMRSSCLPLASSLTLSTLFQAFPKTRRLLVFLNGCLSNSIRRLISIRPRRGNR
jgi:hypothetical protein